jgi:hypothetical protein
MLTRQAFCRSSTSWGRHVGLERRRARPFPLFTARRAYPSAAAASEESENKPKTSVSSVKEQFRIAKTLLHYVWPLDETSQDADGNLRKQRVLASIGLMAAGTAVTIQVPFLSSIWSIRYPPQRVQRLWLRRIRMLPSRECR